MDAEGGRAGQVNPGASGLLSGDAQTEVEPAVIIELPTVPAGLLGPRSQVFVCLPGQPVSFEWVMLFEKEIELQSEEELWAQGWQIAEAYANSKPGSPQLR
jgi:hypothetical protein